MLKNEDLSDESLAGHKARILLSIWCFWWWHKATQCDFHNKKKTFKDYLGKIKKVLKSEKEDLKAAA